MRYVFGTVEFSDRVGYSGCHPQTCSESAEYQCGKDSGGAGETLVSPHPERIRDAYELGLTKVILPEWDAMEGVAQNTPHHKYDVAEHTLRALKNVKRDKILRLTMLFHDMGNR